MSKKQFIIFFYLYIFSCNNFNEIRDNNLSDLFTIDEKIYYRKLNNSGDGEIYNLIKNEKVVTIKENLGILYYMNSDFFIVTQSHEMNKFYINISKLSGELVFRTHGQIYTSDTRNVIISSYSDYENQLINLISYPVLSKIQDIKKSNVSFFKGFIYINNDNHIDIYDYKLDLVESVRSPDYFSIIDSSYFAINIEGNRLKFKNYNIPIKAIDIDKVLLIKRFSDNIYILLRTTDGRVIIINELGQIIDEVSLNNEYQYSIVYYNEKFRIGFTSFDDDYVHLINENLNIFGQLFISKNSYNNIIIYKNPYGKFTIRSSLNNKNIIADKVRFLDDLKNNYFPSDNGPVIYFESGRDFFIINKDMETLFQGMGRMLEYAATSDKISVLFFNNLKTIQYRSY